MLNVFFDRPGRVKEVCAFYIDAGHQVSMFKTVLDDFEKDMDGLRSMIDEVAMQASQHCLSHEQVHACMHYTHTHECVESHVQTQMHACTGRAVDITISHRERSCLEARRHMSQHLSRQL